MLKIFEVTFPFFALVLVGWAVARRGWLALEAIPALNVFVLYFALPCLLFRFAAATPIARLFDPTVFGSWLGCALAMVALAMALTRRGRIGWNDAAFGALVAAFSNSGFMGVPLLVDLLGERAAAPAIVTLTVDMVITSSLCIALSRLDGAGDHGVPRALLTVFKGMATNPLPWSIAAGCVVSATGLALPHVVMKPITMLADAASPTALFTLGVVLARAQRLAAGAGSARDSASGLARRSDVPLIVALKLLAHPLLVFGVLQTVTALGAPLDPFTASVMVLVAALPSASNVPMLAERYGADAGRIAQIVLFTTALAFLTFTGTVALTVPR
ncbi:MAG TPA: AEC family transporter [Burkholderiaceae bacterium]|nr:AEC family transporter [Burkholderiaceae bacterium]HNG80024.1 AEC family transporter [Burkholderiaceae bacterium]